MPKDLMQVVDEARVVATLALLAFIIVAWGETGDGERGVGREGLFRGLSLRKC